MNVVLRKADVSDADELFELAKAFATSFRPEKGAFDESLNQLVSEESVDVTVAVSGDRIVGYCLGFDHFTFYANGRVSWVEEIMVIEELRNEGIGRKLMNAFEQWCISRKSRIVRLATRRAAPFYEELGYEKSAVFFRKLL